VLSAQPQAIMSKKRDSGVEEDVSFAKKARESSEEERGGAEAGAGGGGGGGGGGASDFSFEGVSIYFLRNLRDLVKPEFSSYDIKEPLIKFLTRSTKLSLAQQIQASNKKRAHGLLNITSDRGVGMATIFVSYSWSYTIHELVSALEKFLIENASTHNPASTFFWLDFVVKSQHTGIGDLPPDFWASGFREAIGRIGHTLLLLFPWERPVALTRAWCIWELACTLQTNARLSIMWTPSQEAEMKEVLRLDPLKVFDFIEKIDVEKTA